MYRVVEPGPEGMSWTRRAGARRAWQGRGSWEHGGTGDGPERGGTGAARGGSGDGGKHGGNGNGDGGNRDSPEHYGIGDDGEYDGIGDGGGGDGRGHGDPGFGSRAGRSRAAGPGGVRGGTPGRHRVRRADARGAGGPHARGP